MVFFILDRYIGRLILSFTGIALFVLISLSSLVKFIDELRKLGQNDSSLLCSLIYVFLNIPKEIEVFFPMSVLLGTLIGLGLLSNRNELVIMELVGFGHLQIVGAIVKIAILMILLMIIISECVSSITERFIGDVCINKMCNNNISYNIKNNLWMKDGNDFVFVKQVINRNKLFGVDIYHFDDEIRLKIIRHVKYAIFDGVFWKLFDISELDFGDIHCLVNRYISSVTWKTTLTPDVLLLMNRKISSCPIFLLFNYIKYLDQSHQFSGYYKFYLWSKIFLPLSSLIMMFIGVFCILCVFHGIKTEIRILLGIGFGFLFYVLCKVCGILSINFDIPPVVGVMLPNMMFVIIGVFLLYKYH
ncbi:Lipopolysaccharide export system permease protein LptG [Blochmannia endosymbiont of Camponotus (Colobopsis) obliquus]|nr:Lipopolysaccharide export system permease protein LptG [Blochmannia endosymbiont of Camponotus (Colobopsis) obliquus]